MKQMKNVRTQRDIDIIRQSSLKAAVDLMTAMLPTLENKTEVSDLTLKLAAKFNNWVLEASQVDFIHQALEELGDGPDGTRPYVDPRSGSPTNIHGSDVHNLPVTKKQRGYLIGLLKEREIDVIYEEIDELTVSQASAWIDDLKNGGNGDGRRATR
jgi:hypothetical protein